LLQLHLLRRRKRLRDNSVEDQFEYLNKKAGEIAQKTKINFPNIKVAGSLPPQNLTYEADERDEAEIEDNLNQQAQLLDPFV
jgi:homocysteine S-methyltransferase